MMELEVIVREEGFTQVSEYKVEVPVLVLDCGTYHIRYQEIDFRSLIFYGDSYEEKVITP